MIQEQARVTVKVEDEDVCVKMEEVEKKPSTSLLDSLLYDDDADDVLIDYRNIYKIKEGDG